MNIPFINLKAQYDSLKAQINERIQRVLDHGQYIMGPEVEELESALATFTESKHCITVSSGTEALLISLMAIGVKQGDEVITTPFSFVSTAEVIVLLGATPVYVDIDPSTCLLDSSLIEEKITGRTKAIIPVSLFGQPCDMDSINQLAEKYKNITVIEDAAQSFGSTYKGKRSCNLSDIGCTSFFPSKPLGCYGDGGAIFTNDDQVAKLCKEIRIHGQSKKYVSTSIGVGGRMDTLQCAIVLAKLERFDWELKARTEVAEKYRSLINEKIISNSSLGEKKGLFSCVQVDSQCKSVYGQFSIICEDREAIISQLNEAQIPFSIYYPVPINEQPAYRVSVDSQLTPNAHRIAGQILSLPMSPDLSLQEQEEVIGALTI